MNLAEAADFALHIRWNRHRVLVRPQELRILYGVSGIFLHLIYRKVEAYEIHTVRALWVAHVNPITGQ